MNSPQANSLLFFKRFLRNPRGIGAIAPTSLKTARIMASHIPASAAVLEIGAGTGMITKAILEKISSNKQLSSVEVDPHLAAALHQDFPDLDIKVEDVEQTLQQDKTYDIIISGIPFVSMDLKKRTRIFNLVKDRLKENGLFIAFQYSLYTKKELEQIFPRVSIDFSFWNLPPAFIYICKNTHFSS